MTTWFMAINELSLRSQSMWELIAAALGSARKNTNLKPNLIYDGQPFERTRQLEKAGVKIWPHTLSFKSELESRIESLCDGKDALRLKQVRTGAYLRYEIPLVVKAKEDWVTKVLYTDCDVVFQSNPQVNRAPMHLAAWGEVEGGLTRFHFGGWRHFNSGVLIINAPSVMKEHGRFVDFVLGNGLGSKRPPAVFFQKNLALSDQVAINLFYKSRIEGLSSHYNWHPSLGINRGAHVIHFNGLKWNQWEAYRSGSLGQSVLDRYRPWVDRCPAAYEFYSNLAAESSQAWLAENT